MYCVRALSAVINSLSNCSDEPHLSSPHTFERGIHLSSVWVIQSFSRLCLRCVCCWSCSWSTVVHPLMDLGHCFAWLSLDYWWDLLLLPCCAACLSPVLWDCVLSVRSLRSVHCGHPLAASSTSFKEQPAHAVPWCCA